MRNILFYIIILFLNFNIKSQNLFYQDLCHCGVTGAGFSVGGGAGSGSFDVYIEPSSTIKKAWLFSQRYGNANPVNILINGINYNFNSTNQITPAFFVSGSKNSAIHGLDVTNNINPAITNYNITIPAQTQIMTRYGAIYLWIEYENPTLPLTNSVILLNNYDLNNINTNYNITELTPINTNYTVGFAIYSDILGGNTPVFPDGSYVYFNTNLLGLIGGSDYNSLLWGWTGVKGHFYYQNNTLFGMGDDISDSLMTGTDGLADVSSYLNNNDTSFNFRLQWQNISISNAENYYLGFFVSYTPATSCDTFTTSVITSQDTICQGESVQLAATGGVEYSWFSTFSTFNDSTLANPVATPSQTTTYIVTIKNDSGCVKTEHVKVWVNPAPKPDTIVVTPQRCGSTNGSIAVGYIPKGKPPFVYSLTNLQSGNSVSQSDSAFVGLVAS
ncbi:MAG: hypothetical protein IT232_09710 [Flavobacteriales bacterium]|nr:hypothetical protein [Flavobacteriales bacterium]